MSDLVLDAPPQNPRGIRAIVPDGDPGHFKGMKVFCHPKSMAAFGGRRRDPRHSVAMQGEYDTGVAHSLARSGADVGRRRPYVLRVSPCTRQEESRARGGALHWRPYDANWGISAALNMRRFSPCPREDYGYPSGGGRLDEVGAIIGLSG
jgi:hypothetical protein